MTIKTITPETLGQWLKRGEAVLVDVREPAEHAAECIGGACLVPLGAVAVDKLPAHRGKKIVIHCLKGGRGATACEKLLAENPALELYNLEGGIEAWRKAGLPVKSSAGS